MTNKVIIYYTDNNLNMNIANACRKQLSLAAGDIPIICVSQKPVKFGINMVVGELNRSRHSIFKQILAGMVEAWKRFRPETVCLAEHDVLYPEKWFDSYPELNDTFYYCKNKWFMDKHGFLYKAFPCLSTLK